jgi:hypothetical protein
MARTLMRMRTPMRSNLGAYDELAIIFILCMDYLVKF